MHRTTQLTHTLAVLLLAGSVAPVAQAQRSTTAATQQPVVLFDGKSLDAWKSVEQPQNALVRVFS